jgi:hypothetical protein
MYTKHRNGAVVRRFVGGGGGAGGGGWEGADGPAYDDDDDDEETEESEAEVETTQGAKKKPPSNKRATSQLHIACQHLCVRVLCGVWGVSVCGSRASDVLLVCRRDAEKSGGGWRVGERERANDHRSRSRLLLRNDDTMSPCVLVAVGSAFSANSSTCQCILLKCAKDHSLVIF